MKAAHFSSVLQQSLSELGQVWKHRLSLIQTFSSLSDPKLSWILCLKQKRNLAFPWLIWLEGELKLVSENWLPPSVLFAMELPGASSVLLCPCGKY